MHILGRVRGRILYKWIFKFERKENNLMKGDSSPSGYGGQDGTKRDTAVCTVF